MAKKRDNQIVRYCNFLVPEIFCVGIMDCPFLTKDQFNRVVLDTTKMHKFDRNNSVLLRKGIDRFFYEDAVIRQDEDGIELFSEKDSENFKLYDSYFCIGKLNIQSGVSSLIIFEINEIPMIYARWVWLLNIKDDKLCSVVGLSFFSQINGSLYPSICINNGIFTYNNPIITAPDIESTRIDRFFQWFEDQFKKKRFSTFKINEDGFVEFTKDRHRTK